MKKSHVLAVGVAANADSAAALAFVLDEVSLTCCRLRREGPSRELTRRQTESCPTEDFTGPT
jgi:hypothetical protein